MTKTSLFRSAGSAKNKNIRRRRPEEEEDAPSTTLPRPSSSSSYSSSRPPHIATTLDDDGEEGADTTTVTLNRQRAVDVLALNTTSDLKSVEDERTHAYSADHLQRLRQQQKQKRSSVLGAASSSSSSQAKKMQPSDTSLAMEDEQAVEVEVEVEEKPSQHRPAVDVFRGRGVPDPAMISLAKKQRELRRQMDQATIEDGYDYIPLHVNDDEDDDGSALQSRLVRDEDDAADGDDFGEDYGGERLAFGLQAVKALNQQQRQTMKEAIQQSSHVVQSDDDVVDDDFMEEEDEEMLEWERQQIRKGAGGRRVDSATLAAIKKPVVMPDIAELPAFKDIVHQLESKLGQLRTSYKQNFNNLGLLQKASSNLDQELEKIQATVTGAGDKYNYYQDFWQWLQAFTHLLNAKIPALDEVLVEFFSAAYERCANVAGRRELFGIDDLCILAQRPPLPTPPHLPSIQSLRQFRSMRHQQRAAARKLGNPVSFHQDGMSTDDEDMPLPDVTRQKVAVLLEDADSSFVPLKNVLFRVEVWKKKFADDYRAAFAGMSVPELMQVFVMQSLFLDWDPLGLQGVGDRSTTSYVELSSLSWHSAVADFLAVQVEDGGDDDILRDTVQKYVLPYLTRFVFGTRKSENNESIPGSCYDPFSATQTRRLMHAIEDVSFYFDHAQLQQVVEFQHLIQQLTDRVKSIISSTIAAHRPFIVLQPFLPDAKSTYSRIFYTLFGLYSNARTIQNSLAGYVAPDFLQSVGAHEMLMTCILPLTHAGLLTIQAHGSAWVPLWMTALDRLVSYTPTTWFDSVAVDGVTPCWTVVSRFLRDVEPWLNEEWARCAVKVLVQVGDFEWAAVLGKKFQISQ